MRSPGLGDGDILRGYLAGGHARGVGFGPGQTALHPALERGDLDYGKAVALGRHFQAVVMHRLNDQALGGLAHERGGTALPTFKDRLARGERQPSFGLEQIPVALMAAGDQEWPDVLLEKLGVPVWHLRHDAAPGLGIAYPKPQEIGQDRLANCMGAQARFGAPAVVIDMGTAVTFDILTERGYEGGVIAPGIGVMTRYLHEQTALLPALDPADLMISSGVGKSTIDAMKLGCAVGFAGMIDALLVRVLAELEGWGVKNPTLIATGGVAGILPKAWSDRIRWEPNITLHGLEEAFLRGTKS